MKKESKKIYYDAHEIYEACFCESQSQSYNNLNFEESIERVKEYADAVFDIVLDQASATAIALARKVSEDFYSSSQHYEYVEKPLSELKFLGTDISCSDN